jgi:hypothetical protein
MLQYPPDDGPRTVDERKFVRTNELVESERFHNENLHNLCSSPNIARASKSGKIRWMRHVGRTGDVSDIYYSEKSEGKPWPRCDDNIKLDLKKRCVIMWTRFIWLGKGNSGGLL